MESKYNQNKFSRLFNSHNDKIKLLPSEVGASEHPFTALSEYFNADTERTFLKEFEKGLNLLINANEIEKHCYYCFEFELGMLSTNKNAYLNELVTILLQSLQEIKTGHNKAYFDIPAFRFQSNSIRKVLQNIFITYHLDLNDKNRTTLSNWYYLKKPIKSFLLKKQI